MDLNEIHAFVSVVRAGSFTAAGRQIRIPKSTLSRQVSRLEDRLGVQLLKRTTRTLGLTEAGRGYFARCLHAIEEIEEAERFALDASGKPRGTIRVATSYDLGRDYVAPLLPELRRRYPELAIELDLGHRRVDLVAEGFDVALRGGVLDDSNLIARKLMDSGLRLVASPAYLRERGLPRTVSELEGHDGLLLRQAMVQGKLRMPVGDGPPVPLPLRPVLVTNEFSLIRTAALAGLGIAIMEKNMAWPHLDAGELEPVLPELSTPDGDGLYAVYPATHHLTPKVRVFVDFMAEHLGLARA